MSAIRTLPQVKNYSQMKPFISDFLSEMRSTLSKDVFLQKLKDIGIQSRATFFSLLNKKRNLSPDQINRIVHTFDFSSSEKTHLLKMRDLGTTDAIITSEKVLVNSEVLSSPLSTVILNICTLKTKMTREQIEQRMASFSTAEESKAMIDLLLAENLIAVDENGFLRRIEFRVLSTFPGIKSDHSRKYISKTLQMAEEHYDLDLSEREYASFTFPMAADDMGKLKDMIRKFREDIYILKTNEGCNSVVQVNLNAFTVYKDLE